MENIGIELAVCDGYRLGLPTGIHHSAEFLVVISASPSEKSQSRMV